MLSPMFAGVLAGYADARMKMAQDKQSIVQQLGMLPPEYYGLPGDRFAKARVRENCAGCGAPPISNPARCDYCGRLR